jgi:hypothetical protein
MSGTPTSEVLNRHRDRVYPDPGDYHFIDGTRFRFEFVADNQDIERFAEQLHRHLAKPLTSKT